MARVLIIDDDPQVLTMAEEAMSNFHQVQTALGGRLGMQMIRNNTFDLVFTEIVMPEVDGFEILMESVGKLNQPKFVAMISGSTILNRDGLASVAKCMKVEHVLHKPFSEYELMDAAKI